MKYKLKYKDLYEVIEERDAMENVSLSFFISDVSIHSDKINLYKAFRIKDDKEIILKNYTYKISLSGEEKISFIMPPEEIYLKPFKIENENKIEIRVDNSNIKDIEYRGNIGDYTSLVSNALYSDDYDVGLMDYHFDELPTKIFKGKIKVELYLIKEANIIVVCDNKKYEYNSKKSIDIKENGKKLTLYVYKYLAIDFTKPSSLEFIKN